MSLVCVFGFAVCRDSKPRLYTHVFSVSNERHPPPTVVLASPVDTFFTRGAACDMHPVTRKIRRGKHMWWLPMLTETCRIMIQNISLTVTVVVAVVVAVVVTVTVAVTVTCVVCSGPP